MIVGMEKFDLVVHEADLEAFLNDLQGLGMVEIVARGEADPVSRELEARIRRTEAVQKRLSEREVEAVEGLDSEPLDTHTAPPTSEVEELEKELEEIQRKTLLLREELAQLEPWGDFSMEDLRGLEETASLRFCFFEVPERKFDPTWLESHGIAIVHRAGGRIYFVCVAREGETAAAEDLPLVAATLPRTSGRDLRLMLRDLLRRERTIHHTLDDYAATWRDWLSHRIAVEQDEFELETVKRAAENIERVPVVALQGWCPRPRAEELGHSLDERGVPYLRQPAGPDDRPPVLLKNNRFAKMFEPIGKLFSLPAYAELDLTALFAPFFLLFFGFCLGDAGYGLVLLTAATVARFKVPDRFKSLATLVQFLAVSTILFGVISGTFFGVELVHVEALAGLRGVILDQQSMLSLALIVGGIQIMFGIAVRTYRSIVQRGWLHGLNPIGWMVLLLSLADKAVTELAPGITTWTAWFGVALIVLFGRPGGKWAVSVGLGLVDLYNITGVVGDLMSYIRLFALGVSSAILGMVVNSIAQQSLAVAGFGPILFILILVVGHTGNLMLASLGAFVHPLRLTFVEFYKNAGFEGGGRQYKPFKKRVRV